MARSRRKTRRRNRRSGSEGGLDWRRIAGFIALIGTFYWLYTTWFLALVMLLPTAVARLVDRSEKKFLARCVFAVNICGALPALIQLWIEGRGVDALTNILTNVWYWVYAYGAAAVGWSLFTGVPPLIGKFVAMRAGRRIQELRMRQQELRDEWGDEVAQEVRMQAEEAAAGMGGEMEELGDLDDLDQMNDDPDQMRDPADSLGQMDDDGPPMRPGATAAAG